MEKKTRTTLNGKASAKLYQIGIRETKGIQVK